jgi:hypothetical protein
MSLRLKYDGGYSLLRLLDRWDWKWIPIDERILRTHPFSLLLARWRCIIFDNVAQCTFLLFGDIEEVPVLSKRVSD